MMIQNKKEFCQMEEEFIKHKQLRGVTLISKFKLLHINQGKITVLF